MSSVPAIPTPLPLAEAPDSIARRARRSGRIVFGGGVLAAMFLLCAGTLPRTLDKPEAARGEVNRFYYDDQRTDAAHVRRPPAAHSVAGWFGTDVLGRSLLARCLMGGAISLLVGLAAAAISVVLGCAVGMLAGYRGGWVDALLMRSVDVLYGLPYILLVILFRIALERPLGWALVRINGLFAAPLFNADAAASLVVLFLAIGLVSWLTMARVVRGQVLSLRAQPFIEACRAGGLTEWRIFTRHLLPNLIGPITVYATLTVPQAILQESFLSFLGIGIKSPLPSWGLLAAEGLRPALITVQPLWWLLLFPCLLLGIALLSLNFMGDGLRDLFDPKREAAKI